MKQPVRGAKPINFRRTCLAPEWRRKLRQAQQADGRLSRALDLDERVDERYALLAAGDEDTRQNGVRQGAALGAITAIGFARDDGRAEHPLGLVIGGIQAIGMQRPQHMGPLFAQPLSESPVVRIGQLPFGGDQAIQPLLQRPHSGPQRLGRQVRLLVG